MRLIVIGVSVVVLVGIATVAVRTLVRSVPEVQVARARPVDSAPAGALSATGYIIAHHKIDVNSKVTGRMKWIGVEKGDRVQSGEVLVELEDEEFKAQVEHGARTSRVGAGIPSRVAGRFASPGDRAGRQQPGGSARHHAR